MERSCVDWFEDNFPMRYKGKGIQDSFMRNSLNTHAANLAHNSLQRSARMSTNRGHDRYTSESNRGALSVLRLLPCTVLKCRRRVEQILHLH
jgi:hypothetical protein